MKKLLLLAVLLLTASIFPQKTFAQVSQDAGASAQLTTDFVLNTNASDKRIVALQNVFKKYNSPLVDEAAHYVYYADKYGIDWKLLPAIAGLESTFGRAYIEGTYNAYGWGSGRIYFTSWAHGIDTISKALSERYYARGADTIYEIGPIYAESPTWAIRVTILSNQIEAEYINVKAESALAINI